MGRKKKPEPDDKEQSARFIEAAEQTTAENVEEDFEKAVHLVFFKREIWGDKDKNS